MAAPFVIRPGRPADAARLAAFGERSFRDAFAAQNRPDDLELYLTRSYGPTQQAAELADPRTVTLVVEGDGQLAGFAQLRPGETPESVRGSFYRKSGFEDVGRHRFMLGNDPQTDRIMARSVASS